MLKQPVKVIHFLLVAAFLLAACAPAAETEAPTLEPTLPATDAPTTAPTEEPTELPTDTPEATATQAATATTAPTPTLLTGNPNELASVKVDEAPTLDGVPDDAGWENAPAVTVATLGGANASATQVSIRSVYTDDEVFFLVTWADPTQSFIRAPWDLGEDGTWALMQGTDNLGSDENEFYEDKISFIWPVDNSIPNFETAGCFTACHAGENTDVKPYGNKYTAEEGQLGDIWHWKSVRNVNQVDDQFLDWTRYSLETPNAGRKSDASEGGGYTDNINEAGDAPAFMLPEGGAVDGSPGFILESEAVPFDASLFEAGDRIPSVIVAEFTGDRADLNAGWRYENGMWTLEFGRALDTGSETDVQFTDLAATYFFGVATFDNAQVRHAFQQGATRFVFVQP